MLPLDIRHATYSKQALAVPKVNRYYHNVSPLLPATKTSVLKVHHPYYVRCEGVSFIFSSGTNQKEITI